ATWRKGLLAGKKGEKRSDAHMDIAPFSSVSAGGNLRLRLSVARREQPLRRSPRRARGRFPRSGWPSDWGWRRSPFIFHARLHREPVVTDDPRDAGAEHDQDRVCLRPRQQEDQADGKDAQPQNVY